ncbi:MAG: hypothetical protein UU93_C0001G0008 [Candidatus Amesbacteria bacterium GW2011_GWA2_42_12]|uniref:Uncharacterized protein n=1 Tax=Candidatus Amesbacteria bacterium GW2011_GWA2_42_12 TaxID=1618356 RepID=A0A0G0Y8W8_9BACT|nr:MAG: hypothetical protein UU93_C0001G0008 [Candidatus Amesbacteria bacterium GW2011_GWA2_42_12]
MSLEISSAPETKIHPLSDLLSVFRARLSSLECRENTKTRFDQLARRGAHKHESWKGPDRWSSVVHVANVALSGIRTQGLLQTATVLEQMLVAEVVIPSRPGSRERPLNPKAVSQAILASEQLVVCNSEKGRHDLAWQLLQARHKYLQKQMKEIKIKPQSDPTGLHLEKLASQQALVFASLKELGPLHQPTRRSP